MLESFSLWVGDSGWVVARMKGVLFNVFLLLQEHMLPHIDQYTCFCALTTGSIGVDIYGDLLSVCFSYITLHLNT